MFKFINRHSELQILDKTRSGLIVVYGRRRIGKTTLIRHWLKDKPYFYSQAIEADPRVQIDQLYADLGEAFAVRVRPKDWSEFLELLKNLKNAAYLCIDEFPYLVASDPTLPSRFQKWVDHDRPSGLTIILMGSSQRMMHDIFLNDAAPLFGRATALLNLKPMSYPAFCQSQKLNQEDPRAFEIFSLVGGIPKYWELLDSKKSALENAEELYFSSHAYMENEPFRLLHDEGLDGNRPHSLLELIGRGVHRPSELGSKLQVPQTHLSRPLRQLVDMSFVSREVPFGESERDSKRSLYRIQDPALRFWFGTFSPHQSRWMFYSKNEKEKLIHDHASSVFEDYVRTTLKGKRYWDTTCELDSVSLVKNKVLKVCECKWTKLSSRKRTELQRNLEDSFAKTKLAADYKVVDFQINDQGFLGQIT